MIYLNSNDGPRPRCYFTSSVLPEYVDHDQVPERKRPFCTISQQSFSHTLTLILPREQALDLKARLENGAGVLKYARVYMKLNDLIDGDFFNHYVKSGNILMLSAGKPGLDNIYSLHEGILRLEVDKATYQRMGLDGVAIPSGGRRHVKTRYAVELNLRLPSMVRGKHGFERIVWAFKNVLNETVTWLFYDLHGKNNGSGPISQHLPKIRSVEAVVETVKSVLVPELTQGIQDDDHDLAAELLEWLTLATMCSPRIQSKDNIDAYLSRYEVSGDPNETEVAITRNTQDLVRFQWHGFIPAAFIKDIALTALKASGDSWFGLTAAAFDGKAYSILQRKHHTMTWEYMD